MFSGKKYYRENTFRKELQISGNERINSGKDFGNKIHYRKIHSGKDYWKEKEIPEKKFLKSFRKNNMYIPE